MSNKSFKLFFLLSFLILIFISGCNTTPGAKQDYCESKGYTNYFYVSNSGNNYDFVCFSYIECNNTIDVDIKINDGRTFYKYMECTK